MARGRQLTGVELARWYAILHSLNTDDLRRSLAQSEIEDAAQPDSTRVEDALLTAAGS